MKLPNPGQALFSAWVWGSGFAWMGVGVAGTVPLLLVGVPYQKVHQWVTAPVFASCTQLATIRKTVHYHPAFDKNRPSVFCQNHINLLDGHVAASAIPHAFSGLMDAWQFKIPIYGWLMSASKGIPVNRGQRDLVAQLSEEAKKRKEIGMSILTFPEGHRTMTGKTRQFRRGVFYMAKNAGMPVVPIAVKGLYEANNKNMGWMFNAFRQVDIFVGPTFETEGLTGGKMKSLAKGMRSYIDEILETGAFPPESTTEELLARGKALPDDDDT